MTPSVPKKSPFTLPALLTGAGLLLFGLFVAGYALQTQKGLEDLGANLSFVGLNYFLFPLVGGITLRFAEVPPAPLLAPPPEGIERLRAEQATPILTQVLGDISKRSYFKSRHMADALKRIGLARRDEELPVLIGYREAHEAGRYALVLRFDSSRVDFERWQQKSARFGTFFGKGVSARLVQLAGDQVELTLIREDLIREDG